MFTAGIISFGIIPSIFGDFNFFEGCMNVQSVKFYHRKMVADVTGPGYFDFTDDGTRHKENVRTADFALERFSGLTYWKRCCYRKGSSNG